MFHSQAKCFASLLLSIVILKANLYDIRPEVGSMHTDLMAIIAHDRLMCREQGLCPTATASITSGSKTECVNGYAGEYECNNIDLLSFVSLSDLGCSDCDGNDIWGWRDTGDPSGIVQLYAIAGTTTGTSFVRVTDPLNPVVVAFVPSRLTVSTIWRDIKVRNNWAYIVADRSGHQMQYFDLTRLRGINSQTTMTHDGYYTLTMGDGKCHNIVIDEQSTANIAYLVGTNGCSGGLYAIDISNPSNPLYAGCFSSDGYTHDAQCITYNGPHTQYIGHEICFAYNVNTVTIIDMTNPMSGQLISRTTYDGAEYVHQGWVSTDHAFLFLDDELDETRGSNPGYARTYIFDIRDLSAPILKGHHDQPVLGIDHNLYVKGSYIYEANYEAGLRILQYDSNINTGDISVNEVAYFDTYPAGNSVSYNGAWSSYPFFDDFIIVQDINRGLFILQATSLTPNPTTAAPTIITNNPTITPTISPTVIPSETPSNVPSLTPSYTPTIQPTISPTYNPSISPSNIPSLLPSYTPTIQPTIQPTFYPTNNPSVEPTTNPSDIPTTIPTYIPTMNPTYMPSKHPTYQPTVDPTKIPTNIPTIVPTTNPTNKPSVHPTSEPTGNPIQYPTSNPTLLPTSNPTQQPTVNPTQIPTNIPSTNPTVYPTANPTIQPTHIPTNNPTNIPTTYPSTIPTYNPTVHPINPTSTNPTVFPSLNPIIYLTKYPTTQPSNSPTLNPIIATKFEEVDNFVITETDTASKAFIILMLVIGSCSCAVAGFMVIVYYGVKRKISHLQKNSVEKNAVETDIDTTTKSPIILIGTNDKTKVLVKY